MTVFFLFIHKYIEKIKNIRREIKSVHWHLEVVLERTWFALHIKKGGIKQIKSVRIEFFSLIDYIYLTYRYNLDKYMIVLVRKHNN